MDILCFGSRDCERIFMAEAFYESRADRLVKSGIDISKKDFLELVIA